MRTSEEILQMVNGCLAAMPYTREPQSLYEPVKYVLGLGGKRLRPTLMMLAYQLFASDIETILIPACGLETYHNYTLLHDDLMDNAPMRRGQQTVHCRWNANTAILSGDSMLVLAYQRIAACQTKYLPQALALFTETALQIGEGQQYDMDFEQRDDVDEEEYIEMIRLKTSVLLACATRMGAILAGAAGHDAEMLYQFGQSMGLAFQLQDDWLDVYGDPRVFGKAIGGDILEGKKTYMLINALRLADPAQRGELRQWLQRKDADPQQKISAVTAIYDALGIGQMAQQRIDRYFRESLGYLEQVGGAPEAKAELARYAESMMSRRK